MDTSTRTIATRDEFVASPDGTFQALVDELESHLESSDPIERYRGWVEVIAANLADAAMSPSIEALDQLSAASVRILASGRRRALTNSSVLATRGDFTRELYGATEAIARAAELVRGRISAVETLESNTLAARLLGAIAIEPEQSNHQLTRRLGITDKSQTSRALRKLREHGFVYPVPSGRYKLWRATPKGILALEPAGRRLTANRETAARDSRNILEKTWISSFDPAHQVVHKLPSEC